LAFVVNETADNGNNNAADRAIQTVGFDNFLNRIHLVFDAE
jgi:hypothetical protein